MVTACSPPSAPGSLPALLTATGRRADHGRPALLRGPDRGRHRGRRDAEVVETLAPTEALVSPSTVGAVAIRRTRRRARRRRRTAPASIVPEPTTKPAAGPSPPASSSRRSRSTCRSSRATTATRAATSRCTSHRQAGQGAFGQPGEGSATYLYAHARDGMFGPIYELAIQSSNGQEDAGDGRPGLHERRQALPVRDPRGPAPPAGPGRRARRHHGGALAPDLRGTQGHAGQDAAAGAARSRSRTRTPKDAHPKAKPVNCG